MKISNAVIKTISITRKQEDFLISENKFSLSKFVQSKLNDYIKELKKYRESL